MYKNHQQQEKNGAARVKQECKKTALMKGKKWIIELEKIIPSPVSSHCMDFSNGEFCGMIVHITAINKKYSETDYYVKKYPHIIMQFPILVHGEISPCYNTKTQALIKPPYNIKNILLLICLGLLKY